MATEYGEAWRARAWCDAWTNKRRLVRYALPSLQRAAEHLPHMVAAYERKLDLLHRVQVRLNRARARLTKAATNT